MLKNNKAFVCIGCERKVPKAEKTCRNHCPYCFLSMHVDEIPGDRESDCKGLMVPISYIKANGTIKITFRCVKCLELHNNKVASDDEVGNLDAAIRKRKQEYPNPIA